MPYEMYKEFHRYLKHEILPNAAFMVSKDETINWTYLHEAAAIGDHKRLELLLTRSSVNRMSKDMHGNTPLHEAAKNGYSRCVKLICTLPHNNLHENGKLKLKGKDLHTIEALHNSYLGIRNKEGLSALHLAVQNGHNQSCRELLLAGADPNVQNNYGDTPLHTACRYGHAGATRILLSSTCDPNKINLNGDTPLHITCAMGRRKLSRILMESKLQMYIKNLQGETPLDIAIRKNYCEIQDILVGIARTDRRRPNYLPHTEAPKKSQSYCSDNIIDWSPYGCHYYPDPLTFPSPKLETLPKEPLQNGEQYFLDLAGNIHKGPISAVTCYCGPFFKHMERQLSCNKTYFRKHKHETQDQLEHKAQVLAMKANDQIEQLTRSMVADRVRCENNRFIFKKYLRNHIYFISNSQKFDNIITNRSFSRCRSLEILSKVNIVKSQLAHSKSLDILETKATIGVSKYPKFKKEYNTYEKHFYEKVKATNLIIKEPKLDDLKLDFIRVSEQLSDLLKKTGFIMEQDQINEAENFDQTIYYSKYSRNREIENRHQYLDYFGKQKSKDELNFDKPNSDKNEMINKMVHHNREQASGNTNPFSHPDTNCNDLSSRPQKTYPYYHNVLKKYSFASING